MKAFRLSSFLKVIWSGNISALVTSKNTHTHTPNAIKFAPILLIDLKYFCMMSEVFYKVVQGVAPMRIKWWPFLINNWYCGYIQRSIFSPLYSTSIALQIRNLYTLFIIIEYERWTVDTFVCYFFASIFCNYSTMQIAVSFFCVFLDDHEYDWSYLLLHPLKPWCNPIIYKPKCAFHSQWN